MRPKSPIRAVTFDVGGTLIRPSPSVGHIYSEVASRSGIEISPALLNSRFRKAWNQLAPFNHTRHDWARLVDLTFSGLLHSPPSRSFFPQLYDRFLDPDVWEIFPDVCPALERLAATGQRLAVISNWDERLRPLLHALKLDRYFEEIVVSCEVGFPKPAPAIFSRAATQLRLPGCEILHVGDDPVADVKGALAAGCRALLLDRDRPAGRDRIRHLNELRECISD